ncbi:MAG TPA: hypothetical protein DCP31_38935 [Cyanobacteria bacterium UBA8543]|nr:hypothetical protein [Cyanobacteria bacterium UBA8543]
MKDGGWGMNALRQAQGVTAKILDTSLPFGYRSGNALKGEKIKNISSLERPVLFPAGYSSLIPPADPN